MGRHHGTLSFRVRQHVREYSLAYQLLAIFVVCTLLIGLIFYLIHSSRRAPPAATAVHETIPAPEVPTPFARDLRGDLPPGSPSVSAVIDRLITAYGGRDSHRAFLSTRQEIEMNLLRDELTLDVVLFWRSPNRMRYTFHADSASIRRSYDGTQAWEAHLRNERVLASRNITGDEQLRFMRDILMSRPVFVTLSRTERLRMLPSTRLEDREVYVLELQREGYVERFFIDQINFLCLQIERDDSDLGTPPQLIRVQMSDFREVEGLVFPFSQQVLMDDVPYSSARVTRIQVNPGALSALFEPPPGHPVTREQNQN